MQHLSTSFKNLKYDNRCHNLDKGVIAAYYDIFSNRVDVDDRQRYFIIRQRRRDAVFLLKPNLRLKSIPTEREPKFVSAFPHPELSNISNEVCYDLKAIFEEPSKQIRRGISFTDRKEITVEDYRGKNDIENLFKKWTNAKEADPKVYNMTFNPGRYKRSFFLIHQEGSPFLVYQRMYRVNGYPYGVIAFSLDRRTRIAYELAFLSLYFDKTLKVINDQNDCIIINSLCELYKLGYTDVNLGTAAGIKGLSFFKHKIPYYEVPVYSN